MKRLLLTLAFLIIFAPSATRAATAFDGKLVKTTTDPAVYYLGEDGRRYVFPNLNIYQSWFPDFSLVRTISGKEMAALPIGGAVPYRPGVRLVKIQSMSDVYLVEPGAVLRKIDSETLARWYFGNDWAKRVDDLDDSFFSNYTMGLPFRNYSYPSGAILRRSSDQKVFLIEGGTKRLMTSEQLKRFLIPNTIIKTIGDELTEFADGSPVQDNESTLVRVEGSATIPVKASVQIDSRPTRYLEIGSTDTLASLRFSTGRELLLNKITVQFNALTNNPSTKELDDDHGGLVYGDGGSANLRDLVIADRVGNVLIGPKQLAIDQTQDQQQTLIFQGSIRLPANVETVLNLKALISLLLPENEIYQFKIPLKGLEIIDPVTGVMVTGLAREDLVTDSFESLAGTVKVSSGSLDPASLVYGTKNVTLGTFAVRAPASSDVILKSIAILSYLNLQEGINNYSVGGDVSGGNETRVRDMVPMVSLVNSQGAVLAGPVPVPYDGRIPFILNQKILAGQSLALQLKGDLSLMVDLGQHSNRLAFDVLQVDQSVEVVRADGTRLKVEGESTNGGSSPRSSLEVKKYGGLKVNFTGVGGTAIAGREVNLGFLSFEPKDEDFEVRSASFEAVGRPVSLDSLSLEYTTIDGQVKRQSVNYIGGSATFANLNAYMPRKNQTSMILRGKLKPKDGGAVYLEPIQVHMTSFGGVSYVSLTSGKEYTDKDFTNGSYSLTGNDPAGPVVRYSELTIEKSKDAPSTIFRDVSSEALRFVLKTSPEGGIRIKKLAFKLTPGDVGTAGLDNDSLERYANVNGDFANDTGMANLWWFGPTDKILLGEGGGNTLAYSIVTRAGKDTTPQGYETRSGDYGLLEYIWPDGSEFTLGPGASAVLSFELNTTIFSQAGSSLIVELAGGSDLLWTDILSGAYTPIQSANGAGIRSSLSVAN